MQKYIKDNLALFVILFLFLCVSLFQITKPFNGYHDFNNAFFGLMAENNLKFGPSNLKFGQMINDDIEKPEFYLNHPQLITQFLALSYYAFGPSEFSTRLPALLASLLSLILFFLLIKDYFSKRVAVLSTLFLSLAPANLYFGKMFCHEPFVLLFSLGAFYTILKYADSKKKRWIWLLAINSFFGYHSGWPYFFVAFVATLFLLYLSLKKSFPVRKLLLFIAINLILSATVFLHIGWLSNFNIQNIIQQFEMRIGESDSVLREYIVEAWFANLNGFIKIFSLGNTLLLTIKQSFLFSYSFIQLTYLFFNFGIGGFIAIAYIPRVISSFKKYNRNQIFILFGFLFFALIHILTFRNGSFIHQYWQYYLLLFVSLSLGILFSHRKILLTILAILLIGYINLNIYYFLLNF